MKMLRMAGFALFLGALAAPLAAQQLASDGETFLKAVRESNGARATELLNAPGSTVVNYRGYDGDNALHVVTRRRDTNWLGFVLGKRADPNVGDKMGNTPLIIAARLGFTEGARTLLAVGAKVDLDNKLGETPLIVAVQQRQPQMVRLLLEAGANPDKADHAAGYTARDYAKRDRRSTEFLKLIESVNPARKATVGPTIQ